MWVFEVRCVVNGKSYVGVTRNNVYGVNLGEIKLRHNSNVDYGVNKHRLLRATKNNLDIARDLVELGEDAFICEILDSDDKENIVAVMDDLGLWRFSPEHGLSEEARIGYGVMLLSEDYIKYKKWFWIKLFMSETRCYNEVLPDVDNLRPEIQQLRQKDEERYAWLK